MKGKNYCRRSLAIKLISNLLRLQCNDYQLIRLHIADSAISSLSLPSLSIIARIPRSPLYCCLYQLLLIEVSSIGNSSPWLHCPSIDTPSLSSISSGNRIDCSERASSSPFDQRHFDSLINDALTTVLGEGHPSVQVDQREKRIKRSIYFR